MYHAGTVAELSAIEPHIVKEVYREALRIVSMLDEQFGEERNVENDDGGIVFIVLNEEDLTYFGQRYPDLDRDLFEYVELLCLLLLCMVLPFREYGYCHLDIPTDHQA